MNCYRFDEFDKINSLFIEYKQAKRGEENIPYANLICSFSFKVEDYKDDNDIEHSKVERWAIVLSDGDNNISFVGFTIKEFEIFMEGAFKTASGFGNWRGKDIFIPVYVSDLNYYYKFFKKQFKNPEDIEIYSVKGSVSYMRYHNFEFRCVTTFCDTTEEEFFGYGKTDMDDVGQNCVKIQEFLSETLSLYTRYNIANIPLTQIKFLKDELLKYKHNSYDLSYKPLPIQDIKEYENLKFSPSGGLCGVNYDLLGKHLTDIYCFDFKSAYAAVMYKYCLFPRKYMGYQANVLPNQYIEMSKEYAINGKFVFKNLRKRDTFTGFSADTIYDVDHYKSRNSNITYTDDEQILTADLITLHLTDIDFETLKICYTGSLLYVEDCYIYERGFLPNSLVACVCKFFEKKNKSKIVFEKKLNKKAVCATYGLNYIDPFKIYDRYEKEGISIKVNELDEMTIDEYKNMKLKEYNEKVQGFDSYSCFHWGAYIAAIQRLTLAKFIKKAIELNIWVYSDTDSVYFRHNEEFIKYINKYNENHITIMKNVQKFQRGNYMYIGEEDGILGGFYLDKVCEDFIVTAKKQYMYSENGELNVTMSGLAKTRVLEIMNRLYDPFKQVKPGFKLPKVQKSYIETAEGVYTLYRDINLGGDYYE